MAKKKTEKVVPDLAIDSFRVGDKLSGPGGQKIRITGFKVSWAFYGQDKVFFDKCNNCLMLEFIEGEEKRERRAWILTNGWTLDEKGKGHDVPVIPDHHDFPELIRGVERYKPKEWPNVSEIPKELYERPRIASEVHKEKIVEPPKEDGQLSFGF